MFAFDNKVNQAFEHGVPREKARVVGPRFSIICWGKRRTLNARNAGADDVSLSAAASGVVQQRALRSSKDHGAPTKQDNADDGSSGSSEEEKAVVYDAGNGNSDNNEPTMTGNEVALLVDEFIQKHKQERERREAKEAKKAAQKSPAAQNTNAPITNALSTAPAPAAPAAAAITNATTPAAPKPHVKPKSRVQGGWNKR